MENQIQKPIILAIDDAKKELVQAINNAIQVHQLPFYILDMILSDVGAQIKTYANNEIKMAQEQMTQSQEQESTEE